MKLISGNPHHKNGNAKTDGLITEPECAGAHTPEVSPPSNGETIGFTMQDFFFLPKLVHLSNNVASMVNQGASSNELNNMVKDSFQTMHNDPRIVINLNVYVNCDNTKPHPENFPKPNTSNLSATQSVVVGTETREQPSRVESHSNEHHNSNTQSLNSKSNPLLNKPLTPKNNLIYKSQPHPQPGISKRIAKREQCNCTRRRPLDELIRQERLFAKQAEKLKYFWRGTNPNHPFVYKKKMMMVYEKTKEAVVKEVIDLSKKMINAEDSDMEQF